MPIVLLIFWEIVKIVSRSKDDQEDDEEENKESNDEGKKW